MSPRRVSRSTTQSVSRQFHRHSFARASSLIRQIRPVAGLVLGVFFAQLAFFAQPPAEAQVVPIGGEFTVNENTTHCVRNVKVATAPDGRFVVTWSATDSQTLLFRRYDADGVVAGGQQVIVDTGSAGDPDVAVDGSGQFVVVWDGNSSIEGRRYDASGQPVGADLSLSGGTGQDSEPRISMNDSGDFVVTWQFVDNANEMSIKAQRYGSDGSPLGSVIDVDTTTGLEVRGPVVARDPDGDSFAVAWQEFSSGATDIKARRFDSGGVAIGGEFRVNDDAAGFQIGPDIMAGGDGGFVVTWHGITPGATFNGAYESVYAADGTRERQSRLGVATQAESFVAADMSNDGGGRVATYTIGPLDNQMLRITSQAQVDLPLSNSLSGSLAKAITIDDRERAVAVWRDERADSSCASVTGARFQTYRVLPQGTTNARLHGTIRQAAWKYFIYFPTASAEVKIELQPPLDKDLDLYARFGDFPNLTNFDCRPFNGTGVAESCTLFSSGAPVLIGVNAWDLEAIDFTLEISEIPALFSDDFESGDTSAWDVLVP